MKKLLVIFTILFLFLTPVLAQSEFVFPKQIFSLSLDGGISIGHTDYRTQKIGPAFRSSFSYYFYPGHYHILGVGFQFGFQQLKGADERTSISTIDGLREISPVFSTSIVSPGLFTEYSYLLSEYFSAIIRLGVTYNFFKPTDNKGEDSWAYKQGIYDNKFFTISPEFGLKFRVDEHINLSVGINYSLAVTDYLDDIATSVNNDSYTNILFGLSYSFTRSKEGTKNTYYEGIKSAQEQIETISEAENQQERDTKTVDKDIIQDSLLVEIPEDQNYEEDESFPSSIINEILLPGDDAFYEGTANFKEEIYNELDRIAEIINLDIDSRWRIEGHMDKLSVSSKPKNLSLDRAKAVLDYLTSKGVESRRLNVYGLEDYFPIGDNDTEDGRKLNRRIMLIKQKTVSIPDRDGDGIPDHIDKCPDQPETFNNYEDEDGCPDEVPVQEETFNQFFLRSDDTFESNSVLLKEVAKFLLDEIAVYIKSDPNIKWRIEGHTDDQGANSFLKELSLERAKTIFDYLISKGLSSEQLTYQGYGSSSPITDNSTAERRSTNRRIMIIREN